MKEKVVSALQTGNREGNMWQFKDILGQEPIKEHLIKAMEQEHTSHAYILSGEPGMGKKMMAKTFAMAMECENRRGGEPCGLCHSCRQFQSDNHPDVIYVTHEKPGSIGVDDIREKLVDDIQIKPYSSPYKIYIVDEAEKMTVQAQNALLKTIEEPPGYGVIMLLTSNSDAFLPTVLSRCVTLSFRPLPDEVIRGYLTERLHIGKQQADVCTAFARGNLGKAISLVQSEKFMEMYQGVLRILKGAREMSVPVMLESMKVLKENTGDFKSCLELMKLWYRDVMVFKATQDVNVLIFAYELTAIRETANLSSFHGIDQIISAIDKAAARLNANVNFDLVMELLLLTIKEN